MIRLKNILSEAALESDPLEGKSKSNAKNWVIGKVNKFTKGIFSDQYWAGQQRIYKELDYQGIRWVPTGAMYEHETVTLPDGQRASVPYRKIWTFEIQFVNNKDKEDVLYGRIVAAGAGPIDDPLDKYDLSMTLG